MANDEDFTEKRKHKRFECKNFAVAANFKACPIVNISMGGFAFSYTNEEEWPFDSVDKGILFGDNIWLSQVSFNTVSQSLTPSDTPSLTESKLCGVQFKDLTADQKNCLQDFINQIAEKKI